MIADLNNTLGYCKIQELQMVVCLEDAEFIISGFIIQFIASIYFILSLFLFFYFCIYYYVRWTQSKLTKFSGLIEFRTSVFSVEQFRSELSDLELFLNDINLEVIRAMSCSSTRFVRMVRKCFRTCRGYGLPFI